MNVHMHTKHTINSPHTAFGFTEQKVFLFSQNVNISQLILQIIESILGIFVLV